MKKTLVVHNGHFHTDDVFTVAVFRMLFPDIQVIRTRDEAIIERATIVADVGGVYDAGKDRFDHHQGGLESRANGVPYASIGLVWKKYGEKIAGTTEAAEKVDERLIQPIDALDNAYGEVKPIIGDMETGVYPFILANVIGGFNITWKESLEDQDKYFLEAVGVAEKILVRAIKRAQDKIAAAALVEKAYQDAPDKRIIILADRYPAGDVLAAHPEPLYVISQNPANQNWHVGAVRTNPQLFENRKDFPESWAGKRDAELAEITGVADAVFCHKGRFLAVAKSKEGAIQLARLAVNSK